MRNRSSAPGPAGTLTTVTDDIEIIDEELDVASGDVDDDEVVLSWWQHPLNLVTLVVSALLIGGMVGWLIGDANATPSPNEVDIGFLQDMREHHEQAVLMSDIFVQLPDTNPELDVIARSISFGQAIEIGRMIEMLRLYGADEANLGETSMGWMGMSAAVGQMPGMASADELDALARSSGAEADQLFFDLMVAHHTGGVEMAAFAADNAAEERTRSLARAIVDSQGDEIAELRSVMP
jgi:uncharacterized protein (DUF305 family)